MKGKRTPGSHVDLGLAILGVLNFQHNPLTQVDIAAWCGCSRQLIEQIEKKALRKIRNRLRFGSKDAQLWHELMNELFNRRTIAIPKPERGT
jgi:transcriptional regulator